MRSEDLGTPRWLVALAALKLKRDEMMAFLDEVKQTSASKLKERIQRAERDLLAIRSLDHNETSADLLNRATSAQVAAQAVDLLRFQAGMTTGEIVNEVSERAKKFAAAEALPTFDSKRGIGSWLVEMSRIVGPSRLLQIATLVRNERVHAGMRPWRLSSDR
jgi:hypothetical protein